jgi:geranylgeranyl pyrophosphate synthase
LINHDGSENIRLQTISSVGIAKILIRAAEPTFRLMEFSTQLTSLRAEVAASIDRFAPPASARPARVHEALRYSLEAGGKRLRPVLTIAVARLWGRGTEAAAAAAAVEFIHTYSLVHDDLPAMDDDYLRRGRPTCHVRFDEATAILAGDALLTLGIALPASAYADDPALATALVRELGTAADSARLIGGQMEDMLAEGTAADADAVRFIHEGKTGAMLSAATACGALVGGANGAELDAAREFGRRLGLAFQAIDDVLDATATSEALGKTAGKDARAGKATLIAAIGLEGARAEAAAHTRAALDALERLPGDKTFLRELAASMEQRGS